MNRVAEEENRCKRKEAARPDRSSGVQDSLGIHQVDLVEAARARLPIPFEAARPDRSSGLRDSPGRLGNTPHGPDRQAADALRGSPARSRLRTRLQDSPELHQIDLVGITRARLPIPFEAARPDRSSGLPWTTRH